MWQTWRSVKQGPKIGLLKSFPALHKYQTIFYFSCNKCFEKKNQARRVFSGVDVWSVEMSCLYTEQDFHLILGFKLSTQTVVFTLNWDSRKVYLHSQLIHLKYDLTKKLSTQTIRLLFPLTLETIVDKGIPGQLIVYLVGIIVEITNWDKLGQLHLRPKEDSHIHKIILPVITRPIRSTDIHKNMAIIIKNCATFTYF